jgi:hypothetical protein
MNNFDKVYNSILREGKVQKYRNKPSYRTIGESNSYEDSYYGVTVDVPDFNEERFENLYGQIIDIIGEIQEGEQHRLAEEMRGNLISALEICSKALHTEIKSIIELMGEDDLDALDEGEQDFHLDMENKLKKLVGI